MVIYDKQAIRINDSDGNQLGYFSKEYSSIYASKIDMGFCYKIKVIEKQQKAITCKIKLINTEDEILPDILKWFWEDSTRHS